MQSFIKVLSEKVFLKRPVLKEVLEKHGKQTLWDYSKTFSAGNTAVPLERKNQFIQTLGGEVSRLLGEEAGERVKQQLLKHYFVSTADHHGPLSHPFFTHTNMLAAASQPLSQEQALTEWIVLASSGVSLNNSSYPRGIQFHVKKTEALKLNFFPFFPSAQRHAPVYNLSAYSMAAMDKFSNYLHPCLYGQVPKADIEAALELFRNEDILKLTQYSDQITLLNSRMVKSLFSRQLRPLNLVYINQEELTVKLLQHHFHNKTDIHCLLFETQCRNQLLNLFEGMPAAFSMAESKGTFLFWGYDLGKQIRIRLVENNGSLESSDGTFKVPLDPNAIHQALEKGILFPSTLLNMLVTTGYYGVKALGGFSQITYLTQMMEAYKKIFPKAVVGDSKTLCGDFIFADIMAGGTHASAATGLDILLYKQHFDPQAFVNLCKTKTLSEVMERVIPILFKILYPQELEYSWPPEAYRTDFSISPHYALPVINL